MGMLRRPDEVYRDPEVIARTGAAVDAHGSNPPMSQLSRADLLEALGT
jgi:hypothetical protein